MWGSSFLPCEFPEPRWQAACNRTQLSRTQLYRHMLDSNHMSWPMKFIHPASYHRVAVTGKGQDPHASPEKEGFSFSDPVGVSASIICIETRALSAIVCHNYVTLL